MAEVKLKRDFNAAVAETYDVIVIGGGIVGAGIARDATLRGLRTLLLEKEDFSCGTTSRSSRLIHGGLRYLKQLDLGLVYQDLREREILLSIAPHLVSPLAFVIPVSRSSPLQRAALPLGLLLYDLLFFRKSLPSHRRLSRSETLDFEPGLEPKGLAGSYLYYDCQVPFAERLCLENALSAAEHGATVLNHARVTGLLRDGSSVSGVQVQDAISGENYQVKARIVVNATGHWVESVTDMLGKAARPMIRRTKGIHLLTPQVSRHAVVLFALSDGRVFFVIPWQGYSLIGTTDTDYAGNLDAVEANAADVNYLLTEARRIFPAINANDIFYTSAGLRALAYSSRKPTNVSRSHKLVDHERKDGVKGFVSVLGGKITAYRAVAEQAVDLICGKLGAQAKCSTARTPLPGTPSVPESAVQQAAQEQGLSVEIVTHLSALYGSRYVQVLDIAKRNPQGTRHLCPHGKDILAQVQHAVENEGALTVGDFMLRRSMAGMNSCQGLDALDSVAGEMGRLLGWSAAEQQRQQDAYRTRVAMRVQFKSGL
ncbi:MAG: glycerol-3-phosphate dehydrogenase/oxidase [Chloroflexi bacterium]|nr:glycerol-3-phosphate dehydrogenase/oxidase [Chloroflexota bacterium]